MISVKRVHLCLVVISNLCKISSSYQSYSLKVQSKIGRNNISTLKQTRVHLQLSSSDLEPIDTSSSSDIQSATKQLRDYDLRQQQYMKKYPSGMGGGSAALTFNLEHLTSEDRCIIKDAVSTLTQEANSQRLNNPTKGRVMLGICAENVQEGLMGLKSWVGALKLPKGLLHGMDVDGVAIDPTSLGAVYIKYNTGGCMTFSEMRRQGVGFDSLWKPGDAFLETYDGDFRGIYFNVELNDEEFRQFGVLPTDLFLDVEKW
mmetsp:Transcript_14214/g.20305  ORF Transcript_14214/g.20305 Transcript_14214/m.20305 type:complete len:259 (+) Transcript_14214:88-864(+)|eukprot:CAMPEP_0184863234 /NCGR_PEP_ID=MMETSP0580-20130426/9919_1 /TAXON_ID=1118495 /ORGANISM="Dactyliosolen fragilissimus" /LENGTH=258 /DNA_ID=CAMNT_0027361437 /DNA_START=35 /DNA_END=811 /DNA_ORIENTATION=-